MSKLIYKIITRAIVFFAFVFVLICLIYVGKRVISDDVTSSIFGYSFYRVSTGSMEPDINPGDLIVVKERDNYEVGMDITYRLTESSTPVTHRIIEIDGDIITAEGINNSGEDAPFDKSCIIGEVVNVWTNFDGFVNFVTSPLGIIIIVGSLFVIIEIFSLIDKTINKEKIENENLELDEEE